MKTCTRLKTCTSGLDSRRVLDLWSGSGPGVLPECISRLWCSVPCGNPTVTPGGSLWFSNQVTPQLASWVVMQTTLGLEWLSLLMEMTCNSELPCSNLSAAGLSATSQHFPAFVQHLSTILNNFSALDQQLFSNSQQLSATFQHLISNYQQLSALINTFPCKKLELRTSTLPAT